MLKKGKRLHHKWTSFRRRKPILKIHRKQIVLNIKMIKTICSNKYLARTFLKTCESLRSLAPIFQMLMTSRMAYKVLKVLNKFVETQQVIF